MLSNGTVGYGLSAAIVSIASSVLTVVKDTTPPLKAFMAGLFGHHWTTHGVFVVIGFVALGYTLTQMKLGEKISGEQLTNYVIGSSAIGTILLTTFYIIH
jgi:hypothetical protein